MRSDDILSIGQLAERVGLAVSAIRFYEEKGLLTPMRNAGGQRRFYRADIRRVSFILIAQQLGFSLGDIKDRLTALPNGRTPSKDDWEAISLGFKAELDARIAVMQRMRDRLDGCIGCGCLSLKQCALYNPDDRASSTGAGPRFVISDDPAPSV